MSSSPAPLPGWIRALHAVVRAFGVFSAGLLLLGVGVVCHMVFVRGVLGVSTIWQTEFVTFSLIAATFLGAPYILLTRGHVAVDVLPLLVGVPSRRVLHLVGSLMSMVFCAVFLYAAVPWWYAVWESGETTASIWRARLWIPYLCVPVGLGLLLLQFLAEAWLVLVHRELPFGLAADDRL